VIPTTSDYELLRNQWTRTHIDYLDRELTYPEKDKLIAIFAIAREFELRMNDVCIAGHFWRMLPYTLNWKVADKNTWANCREGVRYKSPRRIVNQRYTSEAGGELQVPQWSWASMHGSLDGLNYALILSLHGGLLANTIGYRHILLGATQESSVSIAALDIKTHFAEIAWKQGSEFETVSELWNDERYKMDVQFDDIGDMPSVPATFPIAMLVHEPYMNSSEGLVLREVQRADETMFERMGHFTLSYDIPDSQVLLMFNADRLLTLI
jgi:hypothetical protein